MRIQNADMLTCHGNQKGRRDIVEILSAGLDLVDPYIGTKKLVSRRGSILTFSGEEYELKGDPRSGPAVYDLEKFDRVDRGRRRQGRPALRAGAGGDPGGLLHRRPCDRQTRR